jgi:hypothetical protein
MEKLVEYRTCLATLRFLRLSDGSLMPVSLLDEWIARPVDIRKVPIKGHLEVVSKESANVEDSDDRDAGQGTRVLAQVL